MKVLLDSNIILDIILARQPFVVEAIQIGELAISNKIKCYLTASNITDVFYLAKKALSIQVAKKAISNIMNIFEILSVTEKECREALKSDNPDFEDALI